MNNKRGKSALIIVGGAYRSAYYFGVMKALEELNIANNFDTYVGISSGSAILAYFLAGQLEDVRKICEEYVPKKALYNPHNLFIKKRPILNLNYLVDDVFQKYCPLNIKKIKNSSKNFLIPVMHYESGDIKYMDVKKKNIFDAMKATMSIPWLTKRFYEIDGEKYVDPGVADQTIVEEILNKGYSKILVLVNQSELSDIKNWKEVLIEKLFFILNPAMGKTVKYLLFENANYQKLLEKYVEDEIIVISPREPLMSRFENSKTKIQKTIELGYNETIKNKKLIKKLEIFK